MSTRPPEPPSDPWADVLSQVEDALKQLDLGGEPTRNALMDGVRDALETLNGAGFKLNNGSGKAKSESPEVTVVDGGRDESEPPPSQKPKLRVAEPSDEPPPESTSPEGSSNFEDALSAVRRSLEGLGDNPIQTQVRLVKVGPDSDREDALFGADVPLEVEGWIDVGPAGTVSGWQTIYRGAHVRAYRVASTEGRIQVALDGEVQEQLVEGQSLDVEAALIRVGSCDEKGADGIYIRLLD
ncbi:MAG: hypothetical protein QGG40_02540, partial [Myxococcota bacterium]|nr:hypothetical protein [Myxococcota bacterium]